jgi:ATPase subunit of ABC transporter with duplicated ATPase domains
MFRQAFEAATTECVPKQRMRDLERTEQIFLQRVLNAGWQAAIPEATPQDLQSLPRFTFSVPPLLAIFVPRSEILDRAGVILKKRRQVVFSGSVGSGKSTLAKLLAPTRDRLPRFRILSSVLEFPLPTSDTTKAE